jgi:ABC-type Fe3+/spermidine/putrescine transport system ATPase subunit
VQQGSPAEIYHRPTSEYVADFIGSTNLLPGTLRAAVAVGEPCVVEIGLSSCGGVLAAAASQGAAVALTIRPESIRIEPASAQAPPGALRGTVRSSVFLGESTDFLVDAEGVEIRARVSGLKPEISIGDAVLVTLPSQGLVFPRASNGAAASAEPNAADVPLEPVAESVL